MNKYKIIWSPKANQDLNKIYTYIAYTLKEVSIANKTVKKIIKFISSLNYSPERYPKLKYNNNIKNLRKLPLDNFVIIYQIDNISRSSLCFTYL